MEADSHEIFSPGRNILSVSATPMRARHPVSNAVAQDVCGCSVSIAVGWAALSQSGDFTACRGVAAQMGGRGSSRLLACWPHPVCNS